MKACLSRSYTDAYIRRRRQWEREVREELEGNAAAANSAAVSNAMNNPLRCDSLRSSQRELKLTNDYRRAEEGVRLGVVREAFGVKQEVSVTRCSSGD